MHAGPGHGLRREEWGHLGEDLLGVFFLFLKLFPTGLLNVSAWKHLVEQVIRLVLQYLHICRVFCSVKMAKSLVGLFLICTRTM